jgi:hypothetical protein
MSQKGKLSPSTVDEHDKPEPKNNATITDIAAQTQTLGNISAGIKATSLIVKLLDYVAQTNLVTKMEELSSRFTLNESSQTVAGASHRQQQPSKTRNSSDVSSNPSATVTVPSLFHGAVNVTSNSQNSLGGPSLRTATSTPLTPSKQSLSDGLLEATMGTPKRLVKSISTTNFSLDPATYGMIVDFEYFLTVLVVIPHSQLTEAALAILVTQEAVVGVYFVTSKLGIVALTFANSKEAVGIITFDSETSFNRFLADFLSSTVVKKGGFHLERLAALLSKWYSYEVNEMYEVNDKTRVNDQA